MWAPQGLSPPQVNLLWPRLWSSDLGVKTWFVVVRVDGQSYLILGENTNWITANQTRVIVTPTRSSFLLNAGPVIVNMTYLSPIKPNDPVKMSSPFSYIYFTFTSNDTNIPHDVQLYSDITGEWISGDDSKEMTWSGSDNDTLVVLQTSLVSPEPFQVNGATCQDGTVFYATEGGQNVQWQIGPFRTIRENFRNGTSLSNSAIPPPSIISDLNTLAIFIDVGTVQSTTSPVVYTIGIVRDPVVQYIYGESLVPYYRVKYDNVNDLIGAVLRNFSDSVTAAQKLDLQLAATGEAISENYTDLLTISTRQAFGAFDLTVSLSDNNKVNTSDVKAFSRNFGSLGSGGINAPDVIYAAMPAYIYLWPDLLKMLLIPLLEYQESPLYTDIYAAQDIGNSYPNATGDSSAHNMQVEQSANMIIIALAHAQATGDGSLLSRYYDQFNSWANFLVKNTLFPGTEETTSTSDGISVANQTNLVLKGIIGLGAMAKISNYTGHSNDSNHFQAIATQYTQEWTKLAVVPKFISLTYGSSDSGVVYNLYADKLLRTNLVNESVYQLQTDYYGDTASKFPYGIPLSDESSLPISRTDWTMFAAASVTNDTVRNQLVSRAWIHAYASGSISNASNYPFTVIYDPTSAAELVSAGGATNGGGINSFAQGAMFAPLAFSVAVQAPKTSGSDLSRPVVRSRHSNGTVIAGGIVGGVICVLTSIVLLAYCFYRRHRISNEVYGAIVTPFKDRIANTSKQSALGYNSVLDFIQCEQQSVSTRSVELGSMVKGTRKRRESEPYMRKITEVLREIEQIRVDRRVGRAFESSNSTSTWTETTPLPPYESA